MFVFCVYCIPFPFIRCISVVVVVLFSWLVLKRCISGLPKNECPFIPKKLLQQSRSRRVRSITYNETDFTRDLVKRSPIRFPDSLSPLSQTAVNEPVAECEDRRQLGIQILKEKGEYADSMLSRFVGNFIMMFSNQTTAQEVSKSKWISKDVGFVSCFIGMDQNVCLWFKVVFRWNMKISNVVCDFDWIVHVFIRRLNISHSYIQYHINIAIRQRIIALTTCDHNMQWNRSYFICSDVQRCVPNNITLIVDLAIENNVLDKIINANETDKLPIAVKYVKYLAEAERVSLKELSFPWPWEAVNLQYISSNKSSNYNY